jgi:hypothetical protein
LLAAELLRWLNTTNTTTVMTVAVANRNPARISLGTDPSYDLSTVRIKKNIIDEKRKK